MSKEKQLPEDTEVLETEASYEEVDTNDDQDTPEASEGNSSWLTNIVQDHKQNILIGAVVILAGIIYLGFFSGSSPEKEDAAGDAIFMAVRYYENDSLNLALNGDGNNSGLLELASEHSGTSVGNLCNFYIGSIYLRQGNASEAFNYFDAVNKDENFVSATAYSAMASISEDQGDMEQAATYFEKAAATLQNIHTTPFYLQHAARCYQQAENTSAALRLFKQIKDEYPTSSEGQQVEKYIALLEDNN